MPKANIHCCMLSRQLLPNMLPLLDPETRPERVELLVTPDVERECELFMRFCRSLGVGVRRHDVTPFDMLTTVEVVYGIMAECEGESLALNVTGGTKLMALGAYEAAREDAAEIFYVNTQDDSRISLAPEPVATRLPKLLSLKNCLDATGYQAVMADPHGVKREHRKLTEELVRQVGSLSRPLRTLNWYASKATGDPPWVHLELKDLQRPDFITLLRLFQDGGFLRWEGEGQTLSFTGSDERFFVNGGWLELHVQAVCTKLRAEGLLQDLAANTVVQSESGVKNEIDVAFTARNRLFIVECKTRSFENAGKAGTDAINRLVALRSELSGIYGRAMLVSYMPLSKADVQRAKQNSIDLVQAGDINTLRERILHSIRKA